MRYIDAFNHFFPKRIYERCWRSPAGAEGPRQAHARHSRAVRSRRRLRVVEQFPDYSQVLSLGMPSLDRLWGPTRSPEMARLGNDGLAELVAKHPKRFVGYAASLPMNAPGGGVARPSAR